ncbi:MAG: outer membrane protein transport protein [Elusimicrobiales bacterium]|nr:outer membrane protein transport protein [Elusimicrobiales bacterium]
MTHSTHRNRAAALFFLLSVSAPEFLAASGYEFDGIGARSIARGGAVIADAADWSAIYWNPANLADVKAREAGLELKKGNSHSYDGNSFSLPATTDRFAKKHSRSSFFFGSLGAVVPLGKGSALGAGLYMPLLQGSDFKDAGLPGNTTYDSIDYKGFAGITVANISYARKLTENISLALGVNAIRGDIASDAKIGAVGAGTIDKEMDGTGYGVEGIFGGKYQLNDSFSLGAVFRTGADVKIEGDAEASWPALAMTEATGFKFSLMQPPTSGVGAAWKFRKDLTLTCDLTQTWWKGFSNKTTYDNPGTLLADQAKTFDWKNSYKFRAGALWAYDERTDFLAGYAYDTPAIDAGSLDHSAAIDVHMHRFSAAVSRRWGGLQGTLGALAGDFTTRKAGGVKYGLGGGYVMGEVKYKF